MKRYDVRISLPDGSQDYDMEPVERENGPFAMYDEAQAEIERIKKNHGCARHHGMTQFCQEAVDARAEVERLREQVNTLQTEYVRQNPFTDPQDTIDELEREVERLRKALICVKNMADADEGTFIMISDCARAALGEGGKKEEETRNENIHRDGNREAYR